MLATNIEIQQVICYLTFHDDHKPHRPDLFSGVCALCQGGWPFKIERDLCITMLTLPLFFLT